MTKKSDKTTVTQESDKTTVTPRFDKTTVTRESDTGEVNCYGNISYGNFDTNSEGFQNEEDGNEGIYENL